MINLIISYSIKNKLIILLLVLGMVGAGIYSLMTIKLGSVPDITNNQVQVITIAPNLGTEDIEQFVTYPVELAMANLPSVIELRSISRFGLSVVTIVFEDDMGTYLPRQLVQEKLTAVQSEIPEGFGRPFMAPISTGLGEIYQYTLVPDKAHEKEYTPTRLRTIQDWIVKRQMALVPGVVEINSFGGNVKQYEVAINPDKLKSMNIALSEVFDALEQNNANTGGAYIEKNHQANFIRGEGLARSLDDIENIVVKNVNGVPILIGHVAEEVRFGSAVRFGAFTQDGHEAVGGLVLMLKGENPNEVIRNVKTRMKEIQKSLPEGLSIVPFVDRSDLIARTTSTVSKNLMEGALIVIFVLVILLGSLRGGLITASIIPLALLFAFILMKQFDVWANLMSLGAIDFGIIVDGAVIIVEGVVYHIEQRVRKIKVDISPEEMDKITFEAGSTMMNSAFFGQLIILIVFTPILFLTGIEGKMFQPMAYTFGFAVLGALILCLTYVPAVAAIFLRPTPQAKKGWFSKLENSLHNFSEGIMDKIYMVYKPAISFALSWRKTTVLLSILLFAVAGLIFSRMGGEFIPKLDEGDLAMQALIKPGSSLTESIEVSKKIEMIMLENFPEVKSMMARIGVSEIPTDPMPMDIADCFIILEKDMDKWTSAKTKPELIEKMKEKLSVLPGVNYVFTQPVELRFNELLTGVREDVAIKLYGEDLNVLAQKAREMVKIIKTVPGAGDVRAEATSGLPQLTVTYNRSKLAQYGMNVDKLNQYISAAFAGATAGVIFEGEKRFDLVVRLAESSRKDIESLEFLYIDLPGGTQVPLKELADISYQPGPMQISRDNTYRRIYVGVNVRGRDVESMVEDIQQKLDAQLVLPPGYYIVYGGSFENLKRAKDRLTIVVPIALALIFILLYFALRSLSQSIMIYMAVPLAAIGGVLALSLRGMPFSISAGVGFIVLFGVAVLNGLVLISRFNDLKAHGVNAIRDRIMQATRERLRPILLTAIAAIMGFIPMAVSASAGAEVQRPLATVVIGGLITATLLTLLVVPVLYYFVESSSEKKDGNLAKPVVASIVLALCIFNFSANTVNAQSKTLTMDEAVNIAFQHNPGLKASSLGVTKQKKLKKTSFNLDNTQFSLTRGNINSSISDRYIQIDQRFDFPTMYGARSKLQQKNVELSQTVVAVSKNHLARQVKTAYINLAWANAQFDLMDELDSIYSGFLNSANLRYQSGETNRLATTAARAKYNEIALQKQQAAADIEIYNSQLGKLMNAGSPIAIEGVRLEKLDISGLQDSTSLQQNPLLSLYKKRTEVARQAYKVQKNTYLPGLSAGYFTQQLDGVSGFDGFIVGIDIPLGFWSKKGSVDASKIDMDIAYAEYDNTALLLNTRYANVTLRYKKYLAQVNYYENQGLTTANELTNFAGKGYAEGEIDYVEYIRNLDQAINIRSQYLSSLNLYNQTIVELEYLTGNQ